jgi:class 3 adenylate cyclase
VKGCHRPFCDLVGFTRRSEQLDPEDVSATLAPYHARLRSTLERYGGTVETFIGDAVMALFGAPLAHEDNPERAVRAALAVRDELREEGKLDVRIAVNTGEALVRRGACPQEGEGMVAGDVVNTAARLQAAAPVKASSSVRRRTVRRSVSEATGEAYARLRAARQLVEDGRRPRPEADQHLQKALAFGRSVGATRYIREGESLLAASA